LRLTAIRSSEVETGGTVGVGVDAEVDVGADAGV
jgi:hypothetical protein